MPGPAGAARLAALLAAPLQLAAPAAASGNKCNGEFECSGINNSVASLREVVSWRCRYGHTEVDGGDCGAPCKGVRRAPCECMRKADAEEAVASQAKAYMGVSAGFSVVALVAVGCLFRMRRKSQQRMALSPGRRAWEVSENDQASNQQPNLSRLRATSSQQMDGWQTSATSNQQMNEWQTPTTLNQETNHWQTTRVSNQQANDCQMASDVVVLGRQQNSFASVARSETSMLSRSRSRFVEVDEKLKKSQWTSQLIRLAFLGFCVWVVGYALYSALTLDVAWYDTLSSFLSVLTALLLAVAVVGAAGAYAHKHGVQRLKEVFFFSGENSVGPFTFIVRAGSVFLMLIPLLCVAAFLWSFNRMSNPEGKYWACDSELHR